MNKYEALGRYIEAIENLNNLKRQRELLTNQCNSFFNDLKHVNNLGYEPQRQITQALSNLETALQRLQQINAEIVQLIAQSNSYAELCGKNTIEIK